MMANPFDILGPLLSQLPLYLVWGAAAVLALVRWKKHPQVSQLVLVAMLLLFLLSLSGIVLSSWLPLALHTRGMPAANMATVLGIINLVQMVLSALVWLLILGAIFGWRTPESSPSAAPDAASRLS